MKNQCPSCAGQKDVRAIECKRCQFKSRHPRLGTGKYGIGVSMTTQGYLQFTVPKQLVHRVVAERKIGRKIRPGEHVHHKNENKLDNRPSNLEVLSAADHRRRHINLEDASRWGIMGAKARWG